MRLGYVSMKIEILNRWVELVLLFVLVPVALALPISAYIKLGLVLVALAYVFRITRMQSLVSRKELINFPKKSSWTIVFLRFIVIVAVTTIYLYLKNPENLFIVIRKSPLMWLGVSFFYSVFSVYPQEFLYRTFFFSRYELLLKNRKAFILLNAILFSMAHLVFDNALVLVITFIGGIGFALTYAKTKSLMFTSIEHAIYGAWLFTVGMGEMLAFPTP